MTTRAVAAIEDWESEPFSGGYAGLHDLVDAEFSGVVQSGTSKLCLTHGAAVGILDGDIEDFEDGSGTIYEAPSPALPLLALMQERSDEVRAKYYTEDTPISEVDRTLSDGKFSGYIELSENVLSGDYYVVYHAGQSMSVAWVGNNSQLLTDDEAFDRADDEVGIYEVRPVDIEPIEIPEPESPSSAAAGASADVSGSSESGGSDDATSEERDDVDTEDAESEEDAATDDQTNTDTTEAAPTATGAGASATDEAADTTGADDDRATSTGTTGRATATDDEAGADADTPDSTTGAHDSADATGDTATGRSSSDGGTASSPDSGESARDPETESEPARSAGRSPGRDDESTADEAEDARAGRTEPESTERASSESSQSAGTERTTESTVETGATRNDGQTRDAGADSQSRRETSRQTDDGRGSGTGGASADRSSGGGGTGRADQGSTGSEDVSPAGTLETHSIPSLDPSRTATARTETGSNGGVAGGGTASRGSPTADAASSGRQESTVDTPSETGQSRKSTETRATDRSGAPAASKSANDAGAGDPARDSQSRTETQSADDGRSQSSGRAGNGGGADRQPASNGPDPRVADLETELEETEAELERVESELADVEREQDALRRERDDLQAERDSLATEVDRLETERDELSAELDEKESELDRLRSQLEQLEAEFGAATDADRRMSREEALQQTNLFVRYESKGQATLESAHDGNATREEVNENLGLEYHTQFEAPNVSVAGATFDEFLEGTIQYRFVTWVINHLLYEIRDTGKTAALEELYDAIPRIDRAELNGTVSVEYMDDGQQRRSQESFDVALRDRMGNALIVANLNDSRQAATESMMNTLVTAASHVGESEDSLAGAFLVTSSFFEPEALETAAEATSGGLLSRDKRESFVKLSRKRGYHLCLAEAREGQFHLAVPEL